jgi:hypothetical protein
MTDVDLNTLYEGGFDLHVNDAGFIVIGDTGIGFLPEHHKVAAKVAHTLRLGAMCEKPEEIAEALKVLHRVAYPCKACKGTGQVWDSEDDDGYMNCGRCGTNGSVQDHATRVLRALGLIQETSL